jgi:MinD-like ATPase involved in chromosome partitioning or flagellar assembly
VVVVHTGDDDLARALDAALPGVTVVHARGGEDLGLALTSTGGVTALVSHLTTHGGAGWQRLAVVRETMPGLPILAYLAPGAAMWESRHGLCPANGILRGPVDPEDLAREVAVLSKLPRSDGDGRPGVLRGTAIGVLGVGGGAGATTVATMLAGCMLRRGAEVLLADLDRRHGAVAQALHVEPRYSVADLADAFATPDRLDESLVGALTKVHDDLSVLAGAEAQSTLADPRNLRRLVESTRRLAPVTVVDLGDADPIVFPALRAFTGVVVVAGHDVTHVRRLAPALERLHQTAPELRKRTVLNLVDDNVEPSPTQMARAAGVSFDAVVRRQRRIARLRNEVSGPGLTNPGRSLARRIDRELAEVLDLSPAAAHAPAHSVQGPRPATGGGDDAAGPVPPDPQEELSRA